MRALAITMLVAAAPAPAHAERDLCAAGARHRGKPIDLDVKDADVHDVLRLLSDVGRVNLVVGDAVAGKVTLRLRRVPWDQVLCTIAAVHHLSVRIDGTIVLVTPR